jgi:hypothetical protein
MDSSFFLGTLCIMQLFYANQSIRNVRDISNATHDQFHQSEQFLTLLQNIWCSV